ncbi:MAG TPA: hypothetical protein GX506_04430 [Firmicutes bacterium]|nr:hypothetical protein [Bacillota bacterium]
MAIKKGTRLVAGVEITAGNVEDKEPVPAMLEEQEKVGHRLLMKQEAPSCKEGVVH